MQPSINITGFQPCYIHLAIILLVIPVNNADKGFGQLWPWRLIFIGMAYLPDRLNIRSACIIAQMANSQSLHKKLERTINITIFLTETKKSVIHKRFIGY
jgi:hypothetical protein